MAQKGFDPPNTPALFVGREDDLAWLERHTDPGRGSRFDSDILITGESGIGKTALVAAFLNRNREKIPAVWIDCASWDSGQLSLRSVFDQRERDAEVRRSRRSFGLTVVLDGADEIGERRMLDLYFEARNRKRVSQVIITSRSEPELAIREENRRRLSRLEPREVERLINSRISLSDLDDKETLRLIGTVGGVPGAVQIMAGMARVLSSEQLRRVLSGEIYDVADAKPNLSANKIGRVIKPLIVADNERILRGLKKKPKDIFKLEPRQFEELVADLLQDMGYEVTLTQQTRDGGKDILAVQKTPIGNILCLVDAKRYKESAKIGVGMVRTLLGTLVTHGATKAMLATTATYSKDARKMEEKHEYQLNLADYAKVVEWVHKYGE
jgi:restriction system protein